MSYETKRSAQTAILVGVPLPQVTDADNAESLAELERLVSTLGYRVIGSLSQRRPSLAGATILGEGKLKDLAKLTGGTGVVEKKVFAKKTRAAERVEQELEDERAAEQEQELEVESLEDDKEDLTSEAPKELADAVVFDCDLTPSQLANLQSATGVRVLDRTGVIVEIFSRHAKTKEARLQVEIARLNYLAPRLREIGGESKDDGMGGMAGESSLELDRRKIRDRLAELRRELTSISREQLQGRNARAEQNTVALVGYTNAGKSSMMRALTGSEVLVEDKLFATLDTTVRVMQPVSVPKVLVSDTVGFIKKLPHDLVASFRSTLEEAKSASLLLFVVDASDSTFRSQLKVTHEVLANIGVEDVDSRLILNKCDKLTAAEISALKLEFPNAIAMSTKNPHEVAKLRESLIEFFETDMIEQEIFVPYSSGKATGLIRSSMRVLGERHEDDGTFVKVRAHKPDIEKILATIKNS